MALVIKDRVLETSTSTGTGDFALAGAVTGFRTFASVCSTGDTCYYVIEAIDANGAPTGDWETGVGTYSAANTLTRTTVVDSSTGSAVSFGSGTKRVAVAATANQLTLVQDFYRCLFTPNTGSSFSSGFVGMGLWIAPFDCTLLGVKFFATAAAATATIEPVVYSASTAGSPASKLATGSTVTGAVQGVNAIPLSSGLSAARGTLYWVGMNVQTAAISMAVADPAHSAHFTQPSIPAPSTPGTVTFGTSGWSSMWPYGSVIV